MVGVYLWISYAAKIEPRYQILRILTAYDASMKMGFELLSFLLN